MIKKNIIFLVLFVSLTFASMVDKKIENYIGKNKYMTQKKILQIILGNKNKYILDNNRTDDIAILKTLEKNGFMNLALSSPKKVIVTFQVNSSPLLFLKIINDSLNAMGFNFYITKKAIYDNKIFLWTISLDSEYLIDPVSLSEELKQYGCKITNVTRLDKLHWEYLISLNNARIQSLHVVSESTYKLKKPIKPYWINIDPEVKSIFISSYSLNKWHPYIAFFNKRLKILKIYQSNQVEKKVNMEIPQNTKYILIDDKYTLNNIRIGLKIYTQ